MSPFKAPRLPTRLVLICAPAVITLAWSLIANAEGSPVAVFGGGYSYLRVGSLNENGASCSAAVYFNDWFGIDGDVGAYYGESYLGGATVFTGMVGPRLALNRSGNISPFAQLLFGGDHVSRSSRGGTGVAWGAGGGVEISFSQRWALRPQVEYLRLQPDSANAVRVTLGLDFRLYSRDGAH